MTKCKACGDTGFIPADGQGVECSCVEKTGLTLDAINTVCDHGKRDLRRMEQCAVLGYRMGHKDATRELLQKLRRTIEGREGANLANLWAEDMQRRRNEENSTWWPAVLLAVLQEEEEGGAP